MTNKQTDLYIIAIVTSITSIILSYTSYTLLVTTQLKDKYINSFPFYRQQLQDLESMSNSIINGDTVRSLILLYQEFPSYVNGNKISPEDLSQIPRASKYLITFNPNSDTNSFGLNFIERR